MTRLANGFLGRRKSVVFSIALTLSESRPTSFQMFLRMWCHETSSEERYM